jgi:Holliday junction DNA helicase RuvB
MNANIHIINGPSIEKTGDLASILSTLEAGDILFIDEIHRLPRVVEEILYSAMEDFNLSIVLNKDTGSKAINVPLPPFTLIGATTRAGDLSAPLRARFGIVEKLNYYSIPEIKTIVNRTANVFNSTIDESAALEIAKRSRATPRIANRLFKRVRDFANFEGKDNVEFNDAIKALKALKVDEIGLDDVDVRYLKTLIERFNGGPVGLETLANSIGEEIMNLEDVYEPYLLQIGLIDRTPRGRVATDKAYKHLKIVHQEKLF